jgi:hypothetical protein
MTYLTKGPNDRVQSELGYKICGNNGKITELDFFFLTHRFCVQLTGNSLLSQTSIYITFRAFKSNVQILLR